MEEFAGELPRWLLNPILQKELANGVKIYSGTIVDSDEEKDKWHEQQVMCKVYDIERVDKSMAERPTTTSATEVEVHEHIEAVKDESTDDAQVVEYVTTAVNPLLGRRAIVTRAYKGGSLEERLSRGRLPPCTLQRIADDILAGLDFLKEKAKVVHRDIR